jgi:hypothetical protein
MYVCTFLFASEEVVGKLSLFMYRSIDKIIKDQCF